MFNATIRRFALTTAAGLAALFAFAQDADAQTKASDIALVSVEVVAGSPAPELRTEDLGWSLTESGDAAWNAQVGVERDAVLSLEGAEGGAVRASLSVRRDGDVQVADVQLLSDAPADAGAGELPVTLRIER